MKIDVSIYMKKSLEFITLAYLGKFVLQRNPLNIALLPGQSCQLQDVLNFTQNIICFGFELPIFLEQEQLFPLYVAAQKPVDQHCVEVVWYHHQFQLRVNVVYVLQERFYKFLDSFFLTLSWEAQGVT